MTTKWKIASAFTLIALVGIFSAVIRFDYANADDADDSASPLEGAEISTPVTFNIQSADGFYITCGGYDTSLDNMLTTTPVTYLSSMSCEINIQESWWLRAEWEDQICGIWYQDKLHRFRNTGLGDCVEKLKAVHEWDEE